MYNKVSTDLNFVEREKKIEQFWKDNDIFNKSIDERKEGETYTSKLMLWESMDNMTPYTMYTPSGN